MGWKKPSNNPDVIPKAWRLSFFIDRDLTTKEPTTKIVSIQSWIKELEVSLAALPKDISWGVLQTTTKKKTSFWQQWTKLYQGSKYLWDRIKYDKHWVCNFVSFFWKGRHGHFHLCSQEQHCNSTPEAGEFYKAKWWAVTVFSQFACDWQIDQDQASVDFYWRKEVCVWFLYNFYSL